LTSGAAADGVRRVVSASYDGTVRVWDAATCECLCVLRGHRGPVWTVAAIGEFIVSGGADGSVRVWRTSAPGDDTADDANGAGLTAAARGLPHCSGGAGAAGSAADGGSTGNGTASRPASPSSLGDSPALVGRCVRVMTPFGHNSASVRQIWCLQIIGGVIFAGRSDGWVHAWDLQSGAQLWAHQPAAGQGKDGVRRLDVIRQHMYTCTAHGYVRSYRLLATTAASSAAAARAQGVSDRGASASPPKPAALQDGVTSPP
jgi:WD40 repeat protein